MKWAEPFDLTATGGKLDVALDLPNDRGELPDRLSFGICTVSTAAADALVGKIELPENTGWKVVKVDAVPNGDGTVTFMATCEKHGFVLMFR